MLCPMVLLIYKTAQSAKSKCSFVGEWLYVANNEMNGARLG